MTPATMRAVVCRAHGAFDDMRIETVAPPPMIAGGVRIAVRSAGVGFATTLVIAGKHQNTPPLPFTPGTEIAGVVLECAQGVDVCKPGDRVVAATQRGGFAEQVVTPASHVYRMPASLDYADATLFPTLYGTAYGALKWKAALQPGETLLVHGAAGGSGLTALEIGKAMGARVIATASSAEKLATIRAHGADHVIDYRQEDFRERVLALTGGRGADVIYDPVGGDVFDRSLRCIAPEGRILVIGFADGRVPQIPANIILVKNVTVIGFYWGYYTGWAKQAAPEAARRRVREGFDEMFRWFGEGKLKPLTYRRLPLESFAEALHLVTDRKVIGKVSLTIGDQST